MDAGQRVVERLYKELFIDDQWSVRRSGEFTWWPHHLPQRVWCEPARDDAGFGVARVCAESRLFRDVPDGSDTLAKVAALNAFATTSAYLVNDDRTITSRCA